MKKINYVLIFVTIFFLSCENNDLILEINIGESNGSVIIHKLNPPISVSYQNSDSIDLNGDSYYDLTFNIMAIPLLTGYGTETKITKKSGVQVVLSTINNYPDTLSYLANLNSQKYWSDNSSEELILQSYFNRDESKIIGNFITIDEKYLGVKMGNRYGWVKLTNNMFGSLIIEEYAMMK